MRFIIQDKQTPHWDTLIRQKRAQMKLSKAAFGRLFGVSGQAVLYWETGKTQAPYAVTWWLYKELRDKR
jgi:DNA-binding transcriptional regulator YiaG